MAERADDLQQDIEEARHGIEETRASMTEKLELLEERVRETLEETKSAVEDIVENVKGTVDETVGAVRETVDGAKSTVEDIVENVKGTMDETVTTVKQAFDLSYQVDRHPWLMFGGAVLLGSVIGNLARSESRTYGYNHAEEIDENESMYAAGLAGGHSAYADEEKDDTERRNRSAHARTSPRREWLSGLGQFQDEFDIIKGAIVGTIMGTLREMIRQNMPNVAPTLEKAINSASRKMGAEPIEPSAGGERTESERWRESGSQGTPGTQRTSSSPSYGAPGQQRQYGVR
jgi:ElaB/YqjD/DUF883 family membrane-anchored ribosome-binding protein